MYARDCHLELQMAIGTYYMCGKEQDFDLFPHYNSVFINTETDFSKTLAEALLLFFNIHFHRSTSFH